MKPNYEQQARELAEQCAVTLWKTPPYPDRATYINHVASVILHELNLVALLEDKAMLDWLQKQGTVDVQFGGSWKAWDSDTQKCGEGKTLRTAIRNAMREDWK